MKSTQINRLNTTAETESQLNAQTWQQTETLNSKKLAMKVFNVTKEGKLTPYT